MNPQSGGQGVSPIACPSNRGKHTSSYFHGSNTRTFVALDNATARYQLASDATIDITGYSGSLANLAVV
jgi:hypothetical protein